MANIRTTDDRHADDKWLLWLGAASLFYLSFLLLVVFMGADKLSTGAWFASIAVATVLAVFVIPGWAVFGLAKP